MRVPEQSLGSLRWPAWASITRFVGLIYAPVSWRSHLSRIRSSTVHQLLLATPRNIPWSVQAETVPSEPYIRRAFKSIALLKENVYSSPTSSDAWVFCHADFFIENYKVDAQKSWPSPKI